MKKKYLLLGLVTTMVACGGNSNKWIEVTADEYFTGYRDIKEQDIVEKAINGKRGFNLSYHRYEETTEPLHAYSSEEKDMFAVDIDATNFTCHVVFTSTKSCHNIKSPEDDYEMRFYGESVFSYLEGVGFVSSDLYINPFGETTKSTTIFVYEEQIKIDVEELELAGYAKEYAYRRYVYSFLLEVLDDDMWVVGNYSEPEKYNDEQWDGTISKKSQKYYTYKKDTYDFKFDWILEGSYDDAEENGLKVDYVQIDQNEMIDGVMIHSIDSYTEDGFYYVTDTELVDYKFGVIYELTTKTFEEFEIPSIDEYPFVTY